MITGRDCGLISHERELTSKIFHPKIKTSREEILTGPGQRFSCLDQSAKAKITESRNGGGSLVLSYLSVVEEGQRSQGAEHIAA